MDVDALLVRITLDPDTPVTTAERAALDAADLRSAVGLPLHRPSTADSVEPPAAVPYLVHVAPHSVDGELVHEAAFRPAILRAPDRVESWPHDAERPEVAAAVDQVKQGGGRGALLALMRALTS